MLNGLPGDDLLDDNMAKALVARGELRLRTRYARLLGGASAYYNVTGDVLNGVDSLLSIVQMPAGIPTATFAIGEAGATNAALFAVAQMAAYGDESLAAKLEEFRLNQKAKVEAAVLPPNDDKAAS